MQTGLESAWATLKQGSGSGTLPHFSLQGPGQMQTDLVSAWATLKLGPIYATSASGSGQETAPSPVTAEPEFVQLSASTSSISSAGLPRSAQRMLSASTSSVSSAGLPGSARRKSVSFLDDADPAPTTMPSDGRRLAPILSKFLWQKAHSLLPDDAKEGPSRHRVSTLTEYAMRTAMLIESSSSSSSISTVSYDTSGTTTGADTGGGTPAAMLTPPPSGAK